MVALVLTHLPLWLAVERSAGVPRLDLDAPLPQVVGHLLLAQVREGFESFQKPLKLTRGPYIFESMSLSETRASDMDII